MLVVLCLGITACGREIQTPEQEQEEDPFVTQYGNITGMTAEQRLEDYEYFWKTLQESYGYWGMLERQGQDMDAMHQDYRRMLEEDNNDVTFYSAIYSILYRIGYAGHLWLVEPGKYESYAQTYQEVPARQTWNEVLNQNESAEKYPLFEQMVNAMEEDSRDGDEQEGAEQEPAEQTNAECSILPGNVAYLKIHSFDMQYFKQDKQQIFDFYQKATECSDIIIDLTDNSGGGEAYWEEILVAPNLTETLTAVNYAMLARSENNAPYIAEAFTAEELHPIEELPLDGVLEEDRAFATDYVEIRHTVEPAPVADAFHGNVWVLTSDAVYSSSESFVIFCKDTGFATVVGTQTGGDGIGIDPVFMTLPNSGLLVQYSMLVGFNKDGSLNEESGTTPDVLTKTAADALPQTLKLIKVNEEK